MNINPFLAILHPRNISEVVKSLNTIDTYDKLWIGRYRFYKASRIAIDYFLRLKEYTHLVLIADDCVVTTKHVDTLVKDIEENHEIEVIGCPPNANTSDWGHEYYGVSLFDIPAKNRDIRVYNRIPIRYAPEGVVPVAHQAGTAAEFISRRLIENGILTLENELLAQITKGYNLDHLEIHPRPEITGCCEDVVMSHQLTEAGIKQYCDFSVPIKHLKPKPKHPTRLLVGLEDPFIRFELKSRK